MGRCYSCYSNSLVYLTSYGSSLIERILKLGRTVALYAAYIIFGILAVRAARTHIGEVFASGDTSFATGTGAASTGSVIWLGIVYVAYNLIVYPSFF